MGSLLISFSQVVEKQGSSDAHVQAAASCQRVVKCSSIASLSPWAPPWAMGRGADHQGVSAMFADHSPALFDPDLLDEFQNAENSLCCPPSIKGFQWGTNIPLRRLIFCSLLDFFQQVEYMGVVLYSRLFFGMQTVVTCPGRTVGGTRLLSKTQHINPLKLQVLVKYLRSWPNVSCNKGHRWTSGGSNMIVRPFDVV